MQIEVCVYVCELKWNLKYFMQIEVCVWIEMKP